MYGCPNTYVFTKAMGEMLISDKSDNLRLIIVRPTIVTSTYKEPFPGWIEGLRYTNNIYRQLGSIGSQNFDINFLLNPILSQVWVSIVWIRSSCDISKLNLIVWIVNFFNSNNFFEKLRSLSKVCIVFYHNNGFVGLVSMMKKVVFDRTIDGLIDGYGKGKLTFFPSNASSILDVVR